MPSEVDKLVLGDNPFVPDDVWDPKKAICYKCGMRAMHYEWVPGVYSCIPCYRTRLAEQLQHGK